MIRKTIFSFESPFMGSHEIYGYIYGGVAKESVEDERAYNGLDHSAVVIGATRGNEYQQLYICSRLSQILRKLEAGGDIVKGKSVLIVPSVNYGAINAGRKYWLSDDSDINREFPGNPDGPATSRMADALLNYVKGYHLGIQLPSYYMNGSFLPHIRMMRTGHESKNLANLFGLPFVLMSDMRSFDQTTLNYNLQVSGTEAFALYSGGTSEIDEKFAEVAVSSILRFLARMGIIKYNSIGGYLTTVMEESEILDIKSKSPGFLHRFVGINEEVHRGDLIAEIIDPMDGTITSEVFAPSDGIIFFAQHEPMIYQNTVLFQMIKKVHL